LSCEVSSHQVVQLNEIILTIPLAPRIALLENKGVIHKIHLLLVSIGKFPLKIMVTFLNLIPTPIVVTAPLHSQRHQGLSFHPSTFRRVHLGTFLIAWTRGNVAKRPIGRKQEEGKLIDLMAWSIDEKDANNINDKWNL
jgi:hypothetical protein